jgi:hypothetical protein
MTKTIFPKRQEDGNVRARCLRACLIAGAIAAASLTGMAAAAGSATRSEKAGNGVPGHATSVAMHSGGTLAAYNIVY